MKAKKILSVVIVAVFALGLVNAKGKVPEWVNFVNSGSVTKIASSLNLPKSTKAFCVVGTGKSEKETLQRAKINAFGDCITSFVQDVSANVVQEKSGYKALETYSATSVSGFYDSSVKYRGQERISQELKIISPFGILNKKIENGVVLTDSVSDTDKELLETDFFKLFTDGDKVKLYTYTTKAKNADKTTSYIAYVVLCVSEEAQKEISDFLKVDEIENEEARNALKNAVMQIFGE